MASPLAKDVELLKSQTKKASVFAGASTVWGIVHVDGHLIKAIKKIGGTWIETNEEPQVYVAEKLERALVSNKRFIALIGGRSSGKSIFAGDYIMIDMHDEAANWYCLREFHESVEASVYSLMLDEAKRCELEGFSGIDSKIRNDNGSHAKFGGIGKNPDSIKSAFGYRGFWVEEAHSISKKSLETLTPTARKKPVKGLPYNLEEIETNEIDLTNVRMIFCANPGSSEDPFSKRFIVPFKEALDRDGYYEDELHTIVKINWSDNPWHYLSGLEEERLFDLKNKPRAEYDHIWEGDFNDHIENSLILPEWFDACVDAHEKIKNFKARGIVKVTHDPSDQGADPKSIAIRHGNVFTEVKQREDLDVNDGCDWAIDEAFAAGALQFEWDLGGMGVGLKRQVNDAFNGSDVQVYQFQGQGGVDRPDSIYEQSDSLNIQKQLTNKQVFKNLRAQCYASIRDRVYRTYRAIEHGEYCDPELMISFSSSITHLAKLRSELCRMPIKPNGSGLFELYTKPEMRKKPFCLPSPNLADSVMMSERIHIKSRRSRQTSGASAISKTNHTW